MSLPRKMECRFLSHLNTIWKCYFPMQWGFAILAGNCPINFPSADPPGFFHSFIPAACSRIMEIAPVQIPAAAGSCIQDSD